MLLLYAKYVLVLWMLIGSNRGDVLVLHKFSKDERLYAVSACTADCLQSRQQHPLSKKESPQYHKLFNNCFDSCRNNTTASEFHQVSTNFFMKLVCRTDTSLTFSVDFASYNRRKFQEMNVTEEVGMKTGVETLKSNDSGIVYIVKINEAKEPKESLVYLSDDNLFTLTNLQPNVTHSLTVLAMRANGQYSMITQEQGYMTLRRGYQPKKVTKIEIEKFVPDPFSPSLVTAHLQWIPNSDMNCYYDILFFSTVGNHFDMPIECRDPRGLYNYDIRNLNFSGEYKVGVRAVNGNLDSDIVWLPFQVPSCLDWYDFNYTLCAPMRPTGLNVTQTVYDANTLSLNIIWDKPQYMPDYYTVRILDHSYNGGEPSTHRVAQDAYSLYLPELEINGSTFEIWLTAHSEGGSASLYEEYTKEPPSITRDNVHAKVLFALIVPLLCLTVLSLTFFWGRKTKLRRYKERCKHLEEKQSVHFPTTDANIGADHQFSGVEMTIMNSDSENCSNSAKSFVFNDEMEINHDDVLLYETLGEGAFGFVRRGMYKGQNMAVKMLRDAPTNEDIQAFKDEIEFMKSVGKHPNIIGLVGYCTKELGFMMLLIEYCSLGNLLNFLRDEWKFRQEREGKTTSIQNTPVNSYQKRCTEDHSEDGNISECMGKKVNTAELHYALLNETHIDDLKSINESTTMPTKYLQFEVSKLSSREINMLPQTTTIGAAENKSYGYEDFCYCSVGTKVGVKNIELTKPFSDFEHIEDILDEEPTRHADESSLTSSICNSCGNPKCTVRSNDQRRGGDRQFTTVENHEYFNIDNIRNNTVLQDRKPLCLSDLLVIARQVAVGMEFLAKNKIVHRDLAARNVLVSADRTIKIADFGLSRDVYQDSVYKKTSSGKLPLKWMALESLTHQVYSTKSDVWSFGILLFEIITLGSIPYPSVPSESLVTLLRMGYRMHKPHECSDEIYKLMLSCWNSSPSERPAFIEIIHILDELICLEDEKIRENTDSDGNSKHVINGLATTIEELRTESNADYSYN